MKKSATYLFLITCLFYFSIQKKAFSQKRADNLDTSFAVGTFNDAVRKSILLSDNKIIAVGSFTSFGNILTGRIARLNQDGTLDVTFNTAGVGADNLITDCVVQPDGKIIIGGYFTKYNGVSINRIARLNVDGSLDNSFNVGTGTNGNITTITLQPDGKIIIGGYFSVYNNFSKGCIARLNSNGTIDNTFLSGSGFNTGVYRSILQLDGKIIVVGAFSSYNGTSVNCIIRLNINGTLDNTFNPGSGPNNTVTSIALQADGKMIIGGGFTSYNSILMSRIARINSDGSLDGTFNAGTLSTWTDFIILQPDNKIFVAGILSSSRYCCRLNADGTIDNSFNANFTTNGSANLNSAILLSDGKFIISRTAIPALFCLNSVGTIDSTFYSGNGSNAYISTTCLQPDGKIVVGGNFTLYNGLERNRIVRTTENGDIDQSFNVGTGANNWVYSTALQSDNKIIIGGAFSQYNGIARAKIARLNSDGSLDNTFTIGTGIVGFNQDIRTIAIQADGKIIIGGGFVIYNGTTVNRIARLNSDGSLDNTFNIGSGFDNSVAKIIIQPDGKILVGGGFTTYNGKAYNHLIRLNIDGTEDLGFAIGSGANNFVSTMAMQSDGKIVVGGNFTNFNNILHSKITRLNTDGSVDGTFHVGIGIGAGAPQTMSIQTDDRIIVGGSFDNYNGITIYRILRLHPNGILDDSFQSGTQMLGGAVMSTNIQPDGRIIIAGQFTTYQNFAYVYIARLRGGGVAYTNIFRNKIHGKVFIDSNDDCTKQLSEKPISSVPIVATPGPYYGITKEDGNYMLQVDSGTASYTITQRFNPGMNTRLLTPCGNSHSVSLNGSSKDTASFDFADSIKHCSALNISVQNVRMRKCARSNTYVQYCNHGYASAIGTQIKIEYPPYVIPISSSPMWTSKIGSSLIYDIGSMNEDTCRKIVIIDSVACTTEDINGLTQCIKATITPVSNCIEENPAWDKASVKVTGSCNNDSANFVIENSGSGDMSVNKSYRVYVNDTLIYIGDFKLKSGEQFHVKYPAEKKTIRLEADQSSLHPGNSKPRAIIENCGAFVTNVASKGLVMTVNQDDYDDKVAFGCNFIVNSFDPNDKQTLPLGTGVTHKINSEEELEYVIRFQNTGTDTAYSVQIIDTLSADLDFSYFTQGVGSHPYELEVTGKGQAILSFNFSNINLPDSSTNKIESNGLISYRIKVSNSASIGTMIKNKAYIYFDYNSPVVTNETIHTIDPSIDQDLSKGNRVWVQYLSTVVQEKENRLSAKIYPNPSTGIVIVETPNYDRNLEIRILSMIGVIQKSVVLNKTPINQLSLDHLNNGIYVFEIWEDGIRQNNGMLQINK